jgi:hypothetical protein
MGSTPIRFRHFKPEDKQTRGSEAGRRTVPRTVDGHQRESEILLLERNESADFCDGIVANEFIAMRNDGEDPKTLLFMSYASTHLDCRRTGDGSSA